MRDFYFGKYNSGILLPRTFLMYDKRALYFGHRRKDNTAWRVLWCWLRRPVLETFDLDHVEHELTFNGMRPTVHSEIRFGIVRHVYSTFTRDPGYGVLPGTGVPQYDPAGWLSKDAVFCEGTVAEHLGQK